MKISIITVCRNAENHFETAIQSVVAQTHGDIEYIVVDGASSDRTLDIAQRYSTHIHHLISEPDDGIYQAMNKGIQVATGDYLYFLNSDDYLKDQAVIQDVVTFIQSQSNCDFLYGNLEVRRGKHALEIKVPKPPEAIAEALMFYVDGPQHPASFFKRELFSILGLFDETYRISADYEWFLRMLQHGAIAIHYIPRTISSFSNQGLSGTAQSLSLKEVFRAQETLGLYQTESWLNRRISRLQEMVIDLNEKWYFAVNSPTSSTSTLPLLPPNKSAEISLQRNQALRHSLLSLIRSNQVNAPILPTLHQVDVVITYNEMNQQHGTGILLRRIFENHRNLLSLRTCDTYQGDHDFGDYSALIRLTKLAKSEICALLLRVLNGSTLRRILCIPYLIEDVKLAIALSDVFDVPLCTYLMDDHNIYSSIIPDDLMQELLQKSDLRLAISPEMRAAYQAKFNCPIWFAPPTLPTAFIRATPHSVDPHYLAEKTGVLIGNVWGAAWLKALRTTLRQAGLTVDWHPNPGRTPAIAADLDADGIRVQSEKPGSQLRLLLHRYPFTLMPTGMLDDTDDLPEVTRLSLPSRLIFTLATAHLPIIVMGSRDSAAAHFVETFQLGTVCSYDANSFAEAVAYVCDPTVQTQIRQRCAAMAATFACDDLADWLWRSLEQGHPADDRFEALIAQHPA
ncbi:MAG: glycosyltransferase [Kaiparowitsia implicata GSE-PSE-MK54-09C]|jgi:glycosyltransferase involved in cell wall biosynthesis|nr:glycosyltransferase [Kaiparowitsia implicata GSE-PSE-MK54-09C]